MVLYLALQFGLRNAIPLLKDVHYLYFTAVVFAFDMLLLYVIVGTCPRPVDFALEDAKAVDLTPWKHGKFWAIVTLGIVILAYIVFSPLMLADKRAISNRLGRTDHLTIKRNRSECMHLLLFLLFYLQI